MATLRLVQSVSAFTHEDAFLARYERLLAWALPLVDGNEAAAEDLLHDAFLQFTLAQPDLNAIENLDAYLRQMLRNLRVSQVRRTAHKREQSLCHVEYDSAALSLQVEETHAGLSAREELQLICQYALARRWQSKAASVLLLRFFHGYLPAEIARLMRLDEAAGRGAVKQWLSLARREARQYLHEPQALAFIELLPETPTIKVVRGLHTPDFLQALRTTIFAAPQTQTCPSTRQWKATYRHTQGESLDTASLAHLVCCAPCLERVNALLHLPALGERFPDDPTSSGNTGTNGNDQRRGRQVRGREALRQQSRRQCVELREQHPAELHVYANGFYVASHTVEAEHNKLSLKLHLDEPLAFIEVVSEQGVRLLYLPAGEAASALKQVAHLTLSEQRTLDATLHFVSIWPTLEIHYCGMRNAECGVEKVTPQFLLKESSLSQGILSRLYSALRTPPSAFQWLLRPVTITILLTALLFAVVVGQKLGWWFAPTRPATAPSQRYVQPHPSNPTKPDITPSVAPKSGIPNAVPSASLAAAASPVTATAELELEALRLLQQAKADTHEQIEVRRTPQGKLRIEGILETDARKSELLQALSSLRNHPAVELQLQTVAEAARALRSSPSAPLTTVIEREEVAVTKLPVDAELRGYFAARGFTEERLEEEIRRFAMRTLAQSRQAARHAGALKNLASRFARDESLAASARANLRTLLREHARALHTEMHTLRTALMPVFAASALNNARRENVPALTTEAEFRRAADAIAALCAETDRALIAAFTLSSNASSDAVIKAPGFWAKLHRGEQLITVINQYLANDQ